MESNEANHEQNLPAVNCHTLQWAVRTPRQTADREGLYPFGPGAPPLHTGGQRPGRPPAVPLRACVCVCVSVSVCVCQLFFWGFDGYSRSRSRGGRRSSSRHFDMREHEED